MNIELGAALGMAGGFESLVAFFLLVPIYLFLVIFSRRLLKKKISQEGRSEMKIQNCAHLPTSTHEALHEIGTSVGAGLISNAIPSIGSAAPYAAELFHALRL